MLLESFFVVENGFQRNGLLATAAVAAVFTDFCWHDVNDATKIIHQFPKKYCNEISKIAVGFGILCSLFIDRSSIFSICKLHDHAVSISIWTIEKKNDRTYKKTTNFIPISMHSNDKT